MSTAALGAAISVVSMFYYLWIIKIIYFDAPAEPLDREAGRGVNGAVLVGALFTVLLVFAPAVGPISGWADAAAQSLTH